MSLFIKKPNYRVATGLWEISSRFLKVHIFWSIFSLKSSLRLKTVLSSMKTLKRYCKATLNVKKKSLMIKKI